MRPMNEEKTYLPPSWFFWGDICYSYMFQGGKCFCHHVRVRINLQVDFPPHPKILLVHLYLVAVYLHNVRQQSELTGI